jgi:hypothetical protein
MTCLNISIATTQLAICKSSFIPSKLIQFTNSLFNYSLLNGLISLPQTLRDKIYDLVAMANTPVHANAYWLNSNGNMTCPKIDRTILGPFPTLHQMSGSWDSFVEGDFCHVQGFAESLNVLSHSGYEHAGQVLSDFLTFIGEHLVLEVRN